MYGNIEEDGDNTQEKHKRDNLRYHPQRFDRKPNRKGNDLQQRPHILHALMRRPCTCFGDNKPCNNITDKKGYNPGGNGKDNHDKPDDRRIHIHHFTEAAANAGYFLISIGAK